MSRESKSYEEDQAAAIQEIEEEMAELEAAGRGDGLWYNGLKRELRSLKNPKDLKQMYHAGMRAKKG